MSFNVKNIDSTRRRNKKNSPCVEKWKTHDQYIMDQIITKTGCRPPHWKTNMGLRLCSSAKEMAVFEKPLSNRKVQSFDPPCIAIERLDYTYFEDESVTG